MNPSTQPTGRGSRSVAKMAGYFVLLAVGVRILQEIFKEISGAQQFAELSRLSGLAASTLDATKNLDDLIVTAFSLMFAFLLILPVAWTHMITKGRETDPSLTQTLIVLVVIVAGVMLLLEDNLARSFSLVGVVAAVRFRNNLRDPKDAVYIFLALGIGMACGLQAYHVALFLSFFECAILLVLWSYHTGVPSNNDAKILEALRLQEKKKVKTPAEAMAWLSAEARNRLENEVNQMGRYITMANMFVQKTGKKRPNCVITVAVPAGAGEVAEKINARMEDHRGKWRLLGAEEKDGIIMLEYFGRLSKERTPPIHFLERLREADPLVKSVTFRGLGKMLAEPTSPSDETPAQPAQGQLE